MVILIKVVATQLLQELEATTRCDVWLWTDDAAV